MKDLFSFLEECGEGCATPGNTMGMGNPYCDGEKGEGSEPLPKAKAKKEKKPKKQKKSEEE